jgi:hypothetical protein
MEQDATYPVKHGETGEEAELIRYDPHVKDRIMVRSIDGGERSEFVLDWEPVEGHRQSMYEWLSDKEDVLGTA